MISPGSKGWINKYFDLIENKSIKAKKNRPIGLSEKHYLHLLYGKSGIIFGYPSRLIFANTIDDSKWTESEKLKLLLFESLLLVYQQKGNKIDDSKEDFIESVLQFYKNHGTKSITKVFTFFMKESSEEKLESVFANRVDIKMNLLENKWWVSSLSNVFVYLDVILYYDFLHGENSEALDSYSEYAYNALTAITLSAYSDGVIEEREKKMFDVFLASARLKDNYREKAIEHFKRGASFDDFTPLLNKNWLFKRFVIDLSLLTIFTNHDALDKEINFVSDLATKLLIPENELEESIVMIENFVVRNHKKASYLKDNTSYEKVYSSLYTRWSKVILRNKDKLALELRESKELVALIKKSATQDLSKEEKELVKTQFMDIVKSMPALAIFMLPGGAILLPLILKLLPDLIPSAFRDNEVEN